MEPSQQTVTAQPTRHGMATASLVLGIIAVVTSFIGGGIILGILAIIFGALSIKHNKGKSLAGIITGSIGIALSIIALVFLMVVLPLSMASLQTNQRDVQRKDDIANLNSDITYYISNNQGALPDNEWVSGMAYKLNIIESTQSGNIQSVPPTTTIAIYTTGVNCDGVMADRNYAVSIMLENGSTYCQGT